MNTKYIFEAFILLLVIIIPPRKNFGVKGFMKSWDSYIEKPVKRLIPPKFIRIRYDIKKSPVNIITYISFLVDYLDWIMCIFLFPCMLVLEDRWLYIVWVIIAILFVITNLPISIARNICALKIAKKKKWKVNTQEYVHTKFLAENFVQNWKDSRETKKMLNEYEKIIKPFLKEFERYLGKRKGIVYISDHNLNKLTDKVFPKYQKQLSFSISEDSPQNRLLTVYLIRDNRVVKQVPIMNYN